MAHPSVKHVVIVGGGASGVLMAAHLLRADPENLRVTLIERGGALGRGLAYATSNPAHVLNVRAANMSAFADDPDHFWRWIAQSAGASIPGQLDRSSFAPRALYGRYLESLLDPYRSRDGEARPLDRIVAEARALSETPEGVEVTLDDGSICPGDLLILACGHEAEDKNRDAIYASPWRPPLAAGLPRDAPVLILGSGLTMVDAVLSLLDEGHLGEIVAISRHGLLPQVHRPVDPLPFDAADVPFGTSLGYLWRWFRQQTQWAIDRGGDWRSVVDGIRPHTQKIWRHLPQESRRRFLEHARSWWNVHRHRMAPEIAARLKAAMTSRQLKIVAGKLGGVARTDSGATVEYRPRGERRIETLNVARIFDCRGLAPDPADTRNPILRSLLDQGLARPDPLGIGLDVDANCALIAQSGKASQRILAVGPLTRAALWEIVAIPDIRVQAAQIAAELTAKNPS
ncbi:FAD-dependent oxidoreductase [Methylocapsa polymorpha]|uniref:FAD-dependent oxidoreductase n=1 Tax=Methylocapsa polymorpha TaxID=3080828 RepID=A0ABZ0HWQ7_9HYPH|nr:FAD-dependent oxidoreductase [Methylocapsa sp. RX1]